MISLTPEPQDTLTTVAGFLLGVLAVAFVGAYLTDCIRSVSAWGRFRRGRRGRPKC
jgi:hypothetical protein